MNTQNQKKHKGIPEFASIEEEAEWFDTHDVGDYADEYTILDPKDIRVEPNLSEGITVRLSPDLLSKLRTTAREKGVGPSTLARIWIVEHLRRKPDQPSAENL